VQLGVEDHWIVSMVRHISLDCLLGVRVFDIAKHAILEYFKKRKLYF